MIVAAGGGRRFGARLAKVFASIAGRPLILHTLRRFAECKTVRRVVLVVAKKDIERCRRLLQADARLSQLNCVLEKGGPRRQDSVRRGLKRLDPDCRVVVIHDGARPLVPPRLINRCVAVARKRGAAVAALPITDTVKLVAGRRRVRGTLDRSLLWGAQTPQAFRVDVILAAYKAAGTRAATDDASLVEKLGKEVVVVPGSRKNVKITFPEDLTVAEALLKKREVR